jgi:bifunctional non-homologous end joining protein LigD
MPADGATFCDRCHRLSLLIFRPPFDSSASAPYLSGMLSRTRPVSSGFISPCLPSSAAHLPSGPEWVHEIKHDGYRLMARRDPIGIRLLTRNGHDWSPRYPLIVEAVNRLKARSCLVDGEAVACDDNGVAVFQRLRRKPSGKHVFLFAFDLLELDGQDLRREPLEVRKTTLASLLRGCPPGVRLCEHIQHQDGATVFGTPARWAWKGSCRSGSARSTAAAALVIGSSSRTRRRRRCGERSRRTGAAELRASRLWRHDAESKRCRTTRMSRTFSRVPANS